MSENEVLAACLAALIYENMGMDAPKELRGWIPGARVLLNAAARNCWA